jgi:hypothetical protein
VQKRKSEQAIREEQSWPFGDRQPEPGSDESTPMRGKMLFEYWLEECHSQQAGVSGDQRHGQVPKVEQSTTLHCASAEAHAIPVPTAMARDDLSEPLDVKPLESLGALPEAARKVLEGLEAKSSRNDELPSQRRRGASSSARSSAAWKASR